MKELILASLLAAGISSGGTYAVMQRNSPPPDTQLAEQVRQMNTALAQMAEAQHRAFELQATGIDLQAHAFKGQAEDMNRLTILGRLQVKAITGKDPLDILQKIDATRLGQAN